MVWLQTSPIAGPNRPQPDSISTTLWDTAYCAPDWGGPAPYGQGEVPVFWAGVVTLQVAIETARAPLCITPKPGHMLITDVAEGAEVPVFDFADNNL